jgi:mannose-6-phosphate isomerase
MSANTFINNLSLKPLKLLSNRVRRSYTGGMLIEQWQGALNPEDNDKPEEWIASVVEARNKTFIEDEGLSRVLINEEDTAKLIDLITENSEAFLGEKHIEKYGINTAVLTKVLDSAVRLSIQVHPTKKYAKEVFKSDYGKTEAWYILGGREINGEPPYVLIGFKPGVTKAEWKKYFEDQDIENMIASLHKFHVNPGDVFLIEGGLPHAIGAGCFLIEIQEPTDYTMRVERTTFDGNQLPDFLCHQGVGFEKMLDCFEYKGLTREETFNKYFKASKKSTQDTNTVIGLITDKDTACFTMKKLHIETSLSINDSFFKTFIVLQGNGELLYNGKSAKTTQSDAWFLPASLGTIEIKNTGAGHLDIIVCYAPQ